MLVDPQNIVTKLNRADVFKLPFELYNKWLYSAQYLPGTRVEKQKIFRNAGRP